MSLTLLPSELATWNATRPAEQRDRFCHAPQRNLFLGLQGRLASCCYNKGYLLGRYPEVSLREAWFGAAADRLREAVARTELSLGCEGCHERVKAGNLAGLPAYMFDDVPDHGEGFPTRMDFELSNACNLECIQCRGEFSSMIRKRRERLPPIPSPYGPAFLEELEEFLPHLVQSTFLGGEPFLIPIYYEIWERLARLERPPRITVTTNASLLTDRALEIIERMPFHFTVSLDSVHPPTYEAIRRNASFDRTHRNLQLLLRHCREHDTGLDLNFCPMLQNWRELPDFVRFANELGTTLDFTYVTFPRDCSLRSLPPRELADVISYCETFSFPEAEPHEARNRQTYLDFVDQLHAWLGEAERHDAAFAEVASGAQGIESLLDALWPYLEAEGHDPAAARRIHADIASKIRTVLADFAAGPARERAVREILRLDLASIVRAAPTMPVERLRDLFATFVVSPELASPEPTSAARGERHDR